ncbi:MAG TPA: J domain-containing protein [Oligoflexia bacterium]|nr:J domain-containing protein [Oligoflexia bacterium]
MDSALVKIFGLSQFLILGLIVGTVVVVFVKQWLRDKALEKLHDEQNNTQTDALRKNSAVKRVGVPESGQSRSDNTEHHQPREKGRPQLASAFPSWTDATPAHEILEVAIDADAGAIESAYKRQLKKYHPDRFGGWGVEYAKRAHQIILLLQKSRDRMLNSRNHR